jgi:hypothetical protein
MTARTVRALVVAIVAIGTAMRSVAANLVILESTPGDPLGGSMERVLDSTAGAFIFNPSHPAAGAFLSIEPPLGPFPSPDVGWQFSFATAHQQPPVVGELEAGVRTATFDSGAGPYVRSPLLPAGCTERGAFLVSRLDSSRLDVDFTVRCDGAPGALRGTVRYGAGDAGCAGMPDGTPCDDENACTSGESCHAGRCDGGGIVECDDGDPITDDLCGVRHGCLHGRRWTVAGRLTGTAAGPGGTARVHVDLAASVDLWSDGTYRIAYEPCPSYPSPPRSSSGTGATLVVVSASRR